MNDTFRPDQEGSTEQEIAAKQIIELRADMQKLCEEIQRAENSVAVKLTAKLITLQSELMMMLHILHENDVAGLTKAITELQITNAKPL